MVLWLLYVRCKSRVTFVQRCFRDVKPKKVAVHAGFSYLFVIPKDKYFGTILNLSHMYVFFLIKYVYISHFINDVYIKSFIVYKISYFLCIDNFNETK